MSEIDQKDKELIFFNKAVEYFDKFNTQEIIADFTSYQVENLENNPNLLRDQMLVELDNLKSIIANNPDLKFNSLSEEEKDLFYDFVKFYSVCPICGAYNHYFNLKKFYFNDIVASLKEECIKFMKSKNKKLQKFNINFGIPCCNCFKKNFELKYED